MFILIFRNFKTYHNFSHFMLKVIIQAVHFEPANEFFFKTKFKALEFAFASFLSNVRQILTFKLAMKIKIKSK